MISQRSISFLSFVDVTEVNNRQMVGAEETDSRKILEGQMFDEKKEAELRAAPRRPQAPIYAKTFFSKPPNIESSQSPKPRRYANNPYANVFQN